MYTFTEREFGQTIEASHINDLQTAVAMIGRGVFYPKRYGAAGDGTTDDTVAIQAAIDAAVSSGGIVDGNGFTYRIDTTGHIDNLGGLENSLGTPIYLSGNYSLLVRGNNIVIRNMTLALPVVPQMNGVASFIALAVDGSVGVKIQNVTFDSSALTTAETLSMSQQEESGAIHLTNSQDFAVDNCIFKNGWGRNGVITAIIGCEHGWIQNSRFATTHNLAMWLDGFKHGLVAGNHFDVFCTGGIHLAANTDISRVSERVQVCNNIFLSKNVSLVLGGATACVVSGNLISPIYGGDGFALYGASVEEQKFDCYENTFSNNTFLRQLPSSGNWGMALKLQGNDSLGRVVRNNHFHNNVVLGTWTHAFYTYENAKDNEFTYNKVLLANDGVESGDSGAESTTNNIVEPNY